MGIVFMIVAGAVIGWLAAFMLRAERLSHGILSNMVAGIAGSVVSGLFIAPLIGAGSLTGDRYSTGAIFVSILGAVVVIIIFNLLRGRFVR